MMIRGTDHHVRWKLQLEEQLQLRASVDLDDVLHQSAADVAAQRSVHRVVQDMVSETFHHVRWVSQRPDLPERIEKGLLCKFVP